MEILILTTTNSKENANKLGKELVKNKLAACVNIIEKVTSIYEWKNELVEDNEFLLIIKSKKDLFKKVEKKIKSIHSYETPEIISFDISDGSKEYLEWINSICK
jgi:periplasmic divalent cation tolerance protein